MKKLFYLIPFCCIFNSCSSQSKVESNAYNIMLKTILKSNVNELSVTEADSIKRANAKVIFIDTREKEEYEVSHIENAKWVGYSDFSMERMKGIPKDAKIIAYCSVGARSEKITRQINEAGYSNVSNLYGSIFEWVNQGFPVYNMDGEETNKVHAYNKTWGVWLKKGEKVYE